MEPQVALDTHRHASALHRDEREILNEARIGLTRYEHAQVHRADSSDLSTRDKLRTQRWLPNAAPPHDNTRDLQDERRFPHWGGGATHSTALPIPASTCMTTQGLRDGRDLERRGVLRGAAIDTPSAPKGSARRVPPSPAPLAPFSGPRTLAGRAPPTRCEGARPCLCLCRQSGRGARARLQKLAVW